MLWFCYVKLDYIIYTMYSYILVDEKNQAQISPAESADAVTRRRAFTFLAYFKSRTRRNDAQTED